MPYFKDTNNKLHWLDDESNIDLLPVGSVQITDAQAESLRVTLADVKAGKIAELESAYNAACDADVTHNGVVFQGDAKARGNLEDAIAFRQAGGTLPADFTWRAKDNTNVPFTDADIDALILLIGTNKLAAAANLHAKKDEVEAASSKSAVNAVAW